ncbi:MAG: hypothetical protein INR65_07655 [Gluconacetobacter diazotrophicus]|nr:hypothetical protein [Gluconacetobacter diazotrophicus]
MTPSRLRDCLIISDLSERDLARRLNRPDAEVRRWAMGHVPVPPAVEAWLERVTAFSERHPPPQPSREEAMAAVRTRGRTRVR